MTINIAEKVRWLLEYLKQDDVEIASLENLEDLKALKATRGEESVDFDEYLKQSDEDIRMPKCASMSMRSKRYES